MPDIKKMVDIALEVMQERRRQDHQWGEQNHDPFTWLAILGEEVGEANKAALDSWVINGNKWQGALISCYRKELIQVAAVASSMVECIDRGKWNGQPTAPVEQTVDGPPLSEPLE